MDGISIQVDGSGSEPCAGVATKGGTIYLAQGQVVAKWNENGDVWDAVYIHSSADATDIIHFDNSLYVAFGYATAYIYGADTTWTVSGLSAANAYAKYFTVARNNAGNLALWKTETVVLLEKIVGSPIDIIIGERLIARGEVIVVNDRFGVRISEITHPDEKIKSY